MKRLTTAIMMVAVVTINAMDGESRSKRFDYGAYLDRMHKHHRWLAQQEEKRHLPLQSDAIQQVQQLSVPTSIPSQNSQSANALSSGYPTKNVPTQEEAVQAAFVVLNHLKDSARAHTTNNS